MARFAELGLGMQRDGEWALMWLDRAAHHGLAQAQFMMGLAYLVGDGVPENVMVAAGWFYRAGLQGQADAQLYLGYMYANGIGVEVNRERAALWLEKARASGDVLASQWMRELETGVPDSQAMMPLFSSRPGTGMARFFSGAVIRG